MKMNRTSAAAAVIAAGLVASLGALAPATVSADELAAAAPAATQSADAEDPAADVADDAAADADAAPSDGAAVTAVSAVALSDESTAAPEAKTPAAESVAEFNGTKYATFDEALAVAKKTNGATIKLLADAETAGLDLDKDLTIDGDGHALKFTDKGIALWGHALVLKNVNASMAGIGSTPYTTEWGWMAVSASKGASLTLDGATLTMDGAGAGNVHAIYFGSNNKLNLKNRSELTIKNYKQDALEWDGGDGGYNVNIEDESTYTSDHCRSGFTGTFVVTIDNSKVNVVNSTGNGSNGSHFNIKNSSVVDFSGNGSHGLSAGNLSIDSSTVTANNNGTTGITFNGEGVFKAADVRVTGTIGKDFKWGDIIYDGGIRLSPNVKLDVDAASTISITGNKATGLFLDAGTQATFAKGSNLMITGNDASAENAINKPKQDLAQKGGGVVVREGANLTLHDSAVIDNSNAALAGDDLYVEEGGTLTFGATHNDALTEFDGCGHDIDGWYDDAAASRWSAHGESKHVVAVQHANNLVAKEGAIAFKAAHGLARVDYQYVGEAPANAGLPGADSDLEVGSTYTAKTQTAVDGYTFDGWYTDEACTTKWNDGDALTGSMTLYGKWTKNPETPATPAETQKPTTNKPAKKQVKKSVPKTGDETSSALPFALFGGAAAAIGLGIKSRRHE